MPSTQLSSWRHYSIQTLSDIFSATTPVSFWNHWSPDDHLPSYFRTKPVPAAPRDELVCLHYNPVFSLQGPLCICQPEWKAGDKTESGSRFNHFHAITTTLRGVCLPLAEERLSHSGGFSGSWYSPTLPVSEMEGNGTACLFPSHLHQCLFSPLF